MQLASRLDNRFRLLTGRERIAIPHQQMLRATIDWSYQLLSRSSSMPNDHKRRDELFEQAVALALNIGAIPARTSHGATFPACRLG